MEARRGSEGKYFGKGKKKVENGGFRKRGKSSWSIGYSCEHPHPGIRRSPTPEVIVSRKENTGEFHRRGEEK